MLALDEFGDGAAGRRRDDEPHRLCNYLFETAQAFTEFYENCPVLSAPDDVRANRLALCRLAAATLRDGPRSAGDRGAGADVSTGHSGPPATGCP